MNEIDSLDSDCAPTEKDDFKAKLFFSKENTTRMNIGQQKLVFWEGKMHDNNRSLMISSNSSGPKQRNIR